MRDAYEDLGIIGTGGMGVVRRARHRLLQRHVAIKEVKPEALRDNELRARFEREARAAARVSHENVVTIHDFFLDGSGMAVVMEHVNGISARALLSSLRRVPPPLAAFLMACLALSGCATPVGHSRAIPLPHFFQVDAKLCRGGQPTPEGFRELARRGVKTVVNLRVENAAHQAADRRLAESLGMRWISMPMRAYWRPSDAQVLAFLDLVEDPAQQPVFIHCRKGEDRTGVLTAVYRVVEYDWEPQRAYREARSLGLSGLNLLMRYVILHEAPTEYRAASQHHREAAMPRVRTATLR